MCKHLSTIALTVLLFFSSPLQAATGCGPDENCCAIEAPSIADTHNQVADLCLLACIAHSKNRQGSAASSFSPITQSCKSANETIENALTSERFVQFAVGCAGGAWSAMVNNFMELLAPEEARRFVAECKKDLKCRRSLARKISAYSVRKEDGSYVMSDAEVDRAAAKLDFHELLERSRLNEGVTYDSCQKRLAEITHELTSDLASAELGEQQKAVLQKRHDLLAHFNPECPKLLKLSSLSNGLHSPDPKKALEDLRENASGASAHLTARVEQWYSETGIAFQCYDGATQGDLLCYGVGKVLLDPVNLGAAALFKKLALARVGMKEAEAVAAEAVTAEAVGNESRFIPIPRAKALKSEVIRKNEGRMLKKLEKEGVKLEATEIESLLSRDIAYWDRADEVIPGKDGVYYRGRVFKVTELPTPRKKGGAFTPALEHPEMAAYREKLRAAGYDLAIDSSLEGTGTGAYFSSNSKLIALRPDSSWQTFIHEFQHFEFQRMMDKLQAEFRTGIVLADRGEIIMKESLGAEGYARLKGLIKRGIQENSALDETLAVDAELKLLGWKRFVPVVGTQPKKYALRHQITELEKLGESATVQQRSTLRRLKLQHDAMTAAELATAGGVLVGSAVGGSVAVRTGVSVISDLYEKYTQVFYDEKGHLIGQRKDGKGLDYLKLEGR